VPDKSDRTSKPDRTEIVSVLLDWFARNARDLPWRRTTDPYAIWISEIMLQQTQVKTVLPYWERWMQSLPDIQSLAQAKPERLHKLWEGLGYYTRVCNLQAAARLILAQHGGRFPEQFDDVLALPGIGRYTAGAICSIAFNQPKPILDGNVIRVLTRVFGLSGNPQQKKTNALLWQLAEELVSNASRMTSNAGSSCSRFNQSLMELGALVCTPRQPRCGECPVAGLCVALRQGRVEELPRLAPRPCATARRFVAFVVQNRGRYLVCQRPAGVVNARLWEFPNLELQLSDGHISRAAQRLFGAKPPKLEPLASIKHSITRYRITLDAFVVAGEYPIRNCPPSGRWLDWEELQQRPFASAHKKLLARLKPNTLRL
jgi:A/G-specific adenine glycosylase